MRKIGFFSLFFCIGMILALVFPWLSTHAVPTAIRESSTASPVVSSPPVGSTSDQLRELLLPPRDVEVEYTAPTKPSGSKHARLDQAYGKLPLSFEANYGQTDRRVKFLSRGRGYTLLLTSSEAVFVFTKREAIAKRDRLRDLKPELRQPERFTQTVVRMRLVGANPKPPISGREALPGKVNYFIGNDPAKWRANVPTYHKVEYKDVYPGVNLVYYGNQRQLEYDFVVSPGADPRAIRLAFEGVDKLELDAQGNLILRTPSGEVVQRAPIVYQVMNGGRREISGRYQLKGKDRVGFQVAAYDRTKPLVIDPVLVYSTYLGGSGGAVDDEGFGIAVDTSGNAYVTGRTGSTDFPTTTGALDATLGGDADAFVTKLDPTGSALLYSTFLGGSGEEALPLIAVDAAGNAYVTGFTVSADFPTTPGAFDTTFSGVDNDAFVTKLNPTGSGLVYSTFLGGGSTDVVRGIAVDTAGNAYVTGNTDSTDFPTTPGAFSTALNGGGDAFVTALNAAGSALVYSTFLGGSGTDDGQGIAVDAAGNAYVMGVTSSADFPTTPGAFSAALNGGVFDAFVTKLNPTGSALVYSSFLGGSDFESGAAIAVDAAGNAYVTGNTDSLNYPTTAGAFQPTFGGVVDAFVTKLNPTGSSLVYSTFLGSGGVDSSIRIALDPVGNAYLTGYTESSDFPTTPGAIQTTFGGLSDAFVTKLNPTGTALVYSTFLGGAGGEIAQGIAVDPSGAAYVSGLTTSSDFPAVNALQPAFAGGEIDAFLAKIAEINTPTGTNVGVLPVDLATGTTPATLTYSTVTQEGVTGLVTSSTGPPPPSGFQLVSPATFYDLTTTAVFSGSVTVCINHGGVTSTSQLFHFEGGIWVDRTVSVDTVNHIICAEVTSLSPFAIFEPSVISVTIDIKPGSFPNSINLGSGGTVPVAIFSTTTFDATTVDPLTVTLASAPVQLKGKGTPMASTQDVDGDGRLDLVVHVETEALELSQTDTQAVLEGQVSGGTMIRGNDSVRVVP